MSPQILTTQLPIKTDEQTTDAHEHVRTDVITTTEAVEELQTLPVEEATTTPATEVSSYTPDVVGFQQHNTDDFPNELHHEANVNAMPKTGVPPTCPLTGPDNNEYCFFTDKSKNLLQALSFCSEQGMQLARMNSFNSEFLNGIIDKTFPNTSFSCINKLTMLGNFDVSMRYGSLAYTLGKQCQEETSSPFDICLRHEDCTLVDWLMPHPFFCVRFNHTALVNETGTEKFVSLRKFYSIGQWDYYVSNTTVNNLLDAVKLTAEKPSTSTAPPFVPIEPTCVPPKLGSMPAEVLKVLWNDTTHMPRKFSVLTQSFNDAGFARKCAPKCTDDEAQAHLYVVCAKNSLLDVSFV